MFKMLAAAPKGMNLVSKIKAGAGQGMNVGFSGSGLKAVHFFFLVW